MNCRVFFQEEDYCIYIHSNILCCLSKAVIAVSVCDSTKVEGGQLIPLERSLESTSSMIAENEPKMRRKGEMKTLCISYYSFWSAVAGLQGRVSESRRRGLANCNSMTKGVIIDLLIVARSLLK